MSAKSDTKAFSSHDTAGYVGFANLPNQVHRKSVKKGFEFTLMVVGESGLGKSTLINSLFLTDLYPGKKAQVRYGGGVLLLPPSSIYAPYLTI